MSEKELKIGLIGCGGIGGVHARSWQKVAGARITAACDPDLPRAEAIGARVYRDFESMLASEELDAVDVCTPPHLHAPAAMAALRRRLPVICEKPLARTSQEARAMVHAAEASHCLLMTAFCHRFHPPVEFVHGAIQRQELGRVLMFRNRFGARLAGVEQHWFSDREIAGGGALMDTSVHSVDLFRHLVGEVRTARALMATFHAGIHGVEDSAALVLTGENDALGVIEASWVTPWSANVIEIYGERGAALIDYDRDETRLRREGDADWMLMEKSPGNRFVEELLHFSAAVRGETPLRVTGRDGLRAVEVIRQACSHPLG